uniref:Aminopeptidase N n=1 Tax=Lutzomyia longipalpis TaxID=7200 RepID=A0A7G3AWD7_LUTLO
MSPRVAIFLALIALATATTPHGERNPPEEDFSPKQGGAEYRLPTNVLPDSYVVTITPYLYAEGGNSEWTFDGNVRINLRAITDGVTQIVLHATSLEIDNTRSTLRLGGGTQNFLSGTPTYNNQTAKLTFTTTPALTRDAIYTLELHYKGQIHNDMRGLYRSTYQEGQTTKRLASTQFQTTFARRFMPCFDEPSFKAVVTMQVYRPTNMRAWSNMGISTSNQLGDRTLDVFHPTPKVSTYLLALIISEFTSRSTPAGDPKPHSIIARPEMYDLSVYAFDVGRQILDRLGEALAYPYYEFMPKMDQAAIPDFSAGAMENLGLLTYRETNLLYSPIKTLTMTKQRIAAVIAHEQAHMWFGDLVTCDWWSYTWLNEGFARYYQYHGTALVETDLALGHQFVVEQLQGVFQMDSSNSTHPMTDPTVNSPSEVSGIFDNISYNKGATFIRMIDYHLGGDRLRNALRSYLRDREFSTAVPNDLLRALQTQQQTQHEIDLVFNSWTTQPGYPVVNVNINSARSQATLTQKRFRSYSSETSDTERWSIPITFASKTQYSLTDTTTRHVMHTQELNVTLTPAPNAWVIFNVQQVGYYRVNYDTDSWNIIISALKETAHDGIHILNRAQIVDDLMNLARAGYVPYGTTFQMLEYLKSERNYIPWLSAFNGLNHFRRRITDGNKELFGKYIRGLLDGVYTHLGFAPKTSEPTIDIYNRANVISWACKYGHEDCLTNAKDQFAKLRNDPTNYIIPVDIRPTVYCEGLREGGQDAFNFLWQRYLSENVATEQIIILNSLGCTNTDATVNALIDNILSSAVRDQDKSSAFSNTYAHNEENIRRVWNYITNNHAKMQTALGSYGSVASYMSGVINRFRTNEELELVKTFINTHGNTFGDARESLNRAVANLEFDLYWDSKYMDHVIKGIGGAGIRTISAFLVLFTNGVEKRMVLTHFQTSYAKLFMPCFDQPDMKANYTLTVRRRADMTAWSNMPIATSAKDPNPDYILDTFHPTMSMSTYLLGLVVAEYSEKKIENTSGPEFFTISHPSMIDYTEYVAQVGHRKLKVLEAFLDFPLSAFMTKIHLVAVPDFNAYAMENPGLITFRESLMLYNARKTSMLHKLRIAMVATHEIAHMWFGGVVTCEWWSYTWLNEGLATYFAHQTVPGVEESSILSHLFTINVLQCALRNDADDSTIPMTNSDVETHEQIREMFYVVSYEKSASVVRMMEHYMGRGDFQKSLMQYIDKRKFNTATPDDLFAAFNNTLNHNEEFRDIFYTYTRQPGYPVVIINVNEARTSAEISQNKFHSYRKSIAGEDIWVIPITYTTRDEKNFTNTSRAFVLNCNDLEIPIDLTPDKWIIFNVQQVGYYRVNYDTKSWELIIEALKLSNHDGIHVINRAQIVDDLLALAQSDNVPYTTVFDMLQYLLDEQEYVPWRAALTHFEFISKRIPNNHRKLFNNYLKFLIGNTYERLGFLPKSPNDPPLEILHRGLIASWACRVAHKPCLDEARKQFMEFRKDTTAEINVDIRNVAYCEGVRDGDESTFEWMLQRYSEENMEIEQMTLLEGLGCANSESIVKLYLNRIFSNDEIIRKNQKFHAFSHLLSYNPDNVNRVWDYVKNNHERMSKISTFEINVDIRNVAYCEGVRDGDESTFEWMLQRYSKENMEIEQMTLLEGLGCANSESIVKLYLNRIFSNDEIIRKNQKFHAFSHLLSYNPDNVNRVWDYVKSNHERMSKILTNGYKDVLKYVKCITMRMNTPQQHEDLQKFIASNGHKFGQYRTGLEVAEKELGELMTWDSVHVTYENPRFPAASKCRQENLLLAGNTCPLEAFPCKIPNPLIPIPNGSAVDETFEIWRHRIVHIGIRFMNPHIELLHTPINAVTVAKMAGKSEDVHAFVHREHGAIFHILKSHLVVNFIKEHRLNEGQTIDGRLPGHVVCLMMKVSRDFEGSHIAEIPTTRQIESIVNELRTI